MKEKILIVEDEYIVADHLKRFLTKAGHQICGIASSFKEAITIIEMQQPTWVLLDICLEGKHSGLELAERLADFNIPFIFLSANMNQRTLEEVKRTKPYGFLSKPFKDKELMIMLDIARDRHEKLHSRSIAGSVIYRPEASDCEAGLCRFAEALYSYVNFDLLCLTAHKGTKLIEQDLYIYRSIEDEYSVISSTELAGRLGISEHEYMNRRRAIASADEPSFYVELAFKRMRMDWPLLKDISNEFGIESQLSFPFTAKKGMPKINVFSKTVDTYKSDDIAMLKDIEATLKDILMSVFPQPKSFQMASERAGSKPKQNAGAELTDKALGGIIGKSPALLHVLEQLRIVAPTSISVLVMGESGTGKEKIAEALHELSPRNQKPLVIVNCAALPSTLIESALFGHEKGAFTGAGEKRIGKFEQADGGTIFLDEIGELPMESQVKLLRVLQEKEVERVGGNQRIKVDVRIIAATNRNMEKEVAEGRFRLDLFYRLNVFPLELPSLRERRLDIPGLSHYFMQKFSAMMDKNVHTISSVVMNELLGYAWPGNIRELSHVIERAVLLAKNGIINEVTLPKIKTKEEVPEDKCQYVKSFAENERDHILAVLKRCFGRVAGEGGAAELLKVPPTTLTSKIKRLGILRKHISPAE